MKKQNKHEEKSTPEIGVDFFVKKHKNHSNVRF